MMADSRKATDMPIAFRDPTLPTDPESEEPNVTVTVSFAGQTHTFTFDAFANLDDLTLRCEETWGHDYNWSNHRFIAPPPVSLIKVADGWDFPLIRIDGKKLRLMTSKVEDVDALRAAAQAVKDRDARRAAQRRSARRPAPSRPNAARAHEDATYTFLDVRPLPNLPNPQRSLDFLHRLKADPGIRAAMRAHRFTVGLLTEMDPLSYTQESAEGTTRILGLNRNAGEVIELRLRTDAYDGYRDYRTIRKTLCHELAHNVHGPHDRNFWDLCHQIEREVDAADYASRGRALEDAPTYDPAEPEDAAPDHGGWTGGSYVLGGGGSGSTSTGDALSRRDILAKAAEERARKERESHNGEGEPH